MNCTKNAEFLSTAKTGVSKNKSKYTAGILVEKRIFLTSWDKMNCSHPPNPPARPNPWRDEGIGVQNGFDLQVAENSGGFWTSRARVTMEICHWTWKTKKMRWGIWVSLKIGQSHKKSRYLGNQPFNLDHNFSTRASCWALGAFFSVIKRSVGKKESFFETDTVDGSEIRLTSWYG